MNTKLPTDYQNYVVFLSSALIRFSKGQMFFFNLIQILLFFTDEDMESENMKIGPT